MVRVLATVHRNAACHLGEAALVIAEQQTVGLPVVRRVEVGLAVAVQVRDRRVVRLLAAAACYLCAAKLYNNIICMTLLS